MDFLKITEQDSLYENLEQMPVNVLLKSINNEDKTVAFAVENALHQIEEVVNKVVEALKNNGRIFYIGAGTSGRLGILDASECPPTFGVSHNVFIGIIAGGDTAIRKAVENAEDSTTMAWQDLKAYDISEKDMVIGIAASGTTPYVVSGILKCNEQNITTACITCNKNSPLAKASNYPIEVVVGPEFVTGSSRMKAGTAQKMVLNMISTASLIRIGRVKGNKMVDMQLSNDKLVDRGIKMLMNELSIDFETAKKLLSENKNVRKVLDIYKKK